MSDSPDPGVHFMTQEEFQAVMDQAREKADLLAAANLAEVIGFIESLSADQFSMLEKLIARIASSASAETAHFMSGLIAADHHRRGMQVPTDA